MSYTLRKEEEEEEADGGEILGGTGYGRWGRVFLFSKSTPPRDTNTTQNCCPFLYRSNATKSEVTRFLNVPLDVSDVFLMTFMILLDSYMEPTRVGSDMYDSCRSEQSPCMTPAGVKYVTMNDSCKSHVFQYMTPAGVKYFNE